MKNEYNIKINKTKTKILFYNGNEESQTNKMLDGNTLEQVNDNINL